MLPRASRATSLRRRPDEKALSRTFISCDGAATCLYYSTGYDVGSSLEKDCILTHSAISPPRHADPAAWIYNCGLCGLLGKLRRALGSEPFTFRRREPSKIMDSKQRPRPICSLLKTIVILLQYSRQKCAPGGAPSNVGHFCRHFLFPTLIGGGRNAQCNTRNQLLSNHVPRSKIGARALFSLLKIGQKYALVLYDLVVKNKKWFKCAP